MQLLHYLNTLRQRGIDAKGRLFFRKKEKTVDVILDDDAIQKLEKMEIEILKIIYENKPPKAVKKRFCGKCAYSEFCFVSPERRTGLLMKRPIYIFQMES